MLSTLSLILSQGHCQVYELEDPLYFVSLQIYYHYFMLQMKHYSRRKLFIKDTLLYELMHICYKNIIIPYA